MTPEQELELLRYELDRIRKEYQPFVPPETTDELAERIGHLQPCHYCGEETNMMAGNPGLWPLQFALCDGTGICRVFHSKCVSERLWKASVCQTCESGSGYVIDWSWRCESCGLGK